MEHNIREYVEGIFQNAPNTQEAYELKIELMQNLTDKYNDLIAEGKTPEDAYNLTILGMGDVGELLKELDHQGNIGFFVNNYVPSTDADAKKRGAMIFAGGVMLCILSIVPVLLFPMIGLSEDLGIIAMFLLVAAGVGLILYNSMTKPQQKGKGDTVVAEFKQWQEDKTRNRDLEKAIMSAFWPLVLVAYFVISFLTHAWAITWLIFLIAPAVYGIIKAALGLNQHGK